MKTCLQLIIVFLCFSIEAQTIVELKQKLQQTSSKNERAILCLEIAQIHNYGNLDEVIFYANKALANSNGKKQIEADAWQLIGNCSIIKGDYKKANQIFEKIKSIYLNDLTENYTGLIKTYGSLGVVASEQNKHYEALQHYFNGLEIAEKQQDKKMLIVLHNNIGVIYRDANQFEKAAISFQKSAKLQMETNDNYAGITFTNLATIAIAKKNYKLANQLFKKAKPYLYKLNDNRAWGEFYNNLGNYNFIFKNFDEAETNLNKALYHFAKIEDQFGSVDSYLTLADVYQNKNQNDKAILYAKKALELGNSLDVLDHKLSANKLLSDLYNKKGNIKKSFQYYKDYAQQKDSFINEENTRKLTEADLNYVFQKKQLEDQALIKQESFQKRIIFLLAILGLVSLLSFYLWKSKKQEKQKLLLEKELLEYEQKALHLQMNPHFVFNCLAAISSYIVQNKTEDATKYLAMFSKLMRFTLESSKESLITIDKEIESINQYLNLENLRLRQLFTFSIEKSEEIDDDMALPPMMLQPIVENAIIHGILPMKQSGTIKIEFYIKEDLLHIEVIDNGIGIENSLKAKNKMSLHKSMAIDIVKKRLTMITKTQETKSNILFEQQTQGTLVRMLLPIQFKD